MPLDKTKQYISKTLEQHQETLIRNDGWANLLVSCDANTDKMFEEAGYKFLGAADSPNGEVHIFMDQSIEEIQEG